MSSQSKKIFLALTVIVPLLIYCFIYYARMVSNAPYNSKEFVSLVFKWGEGGNYENSYNSATGEYQYINSKDSLVKTNVKLRSNDMVFLSHRADELGFWFFPDLIANKGTDLNKSKVLRYFIQFNYKRKSKTVTFVTDYNENEKNQQSAMQVQKMVQQVIDDAEDRYK
ncbi:MAG: hypothetical protein K2Q03_10140 [Sphingobacteriaceae bacterium]|nr:hypothetical protein [Sphingobacteriaceae bacterium]